MANGKFDPTLLEPIENETTGGFDPSLLTAVDDKATPDDQSKAYGQIKQRFPTMPDWFINMLMPAATTMAESEGGPTVIGGRRGAFLRSAVRTPLEAAENLAQKIGLPTVQDAQMPGFLAESTEDVQYPGTQFIGGMAGFAPLGAGVIGSARTIPAYGRLAESAMESLLKRGLLYGGEGAALGGAFAPPGDELPGALAGGALGAGLGSLGPAAARAIPKAAQRARSFMNFDALEGKLKPYTEALESSQQALKGEQAFAKKQFGMQDPDALAASVLEDRAKIGALRSQIEQTPEEDLSRMLGAPKGEELVPRAQSLLVSAEEKAAQAEEALQGHLLKGATHDENVAQGVMQLDKATRRDIGGMFNQVESNLANKNVILENTRTAQDVMSDLTDIIKKGGMETPEAEALANELQNLSQQEIIPAKDFLTAYRTTRDLAYEATSKGYDYRLNAEQKELWKQRGKDLREKSEKMYDTLKQSIGKEDTELLEKAASRWRNEVAPLNENNLYNKFKYELRGPDNIMKEARGGGEGQEIIRKYIKSDPELLRNVVGQRYAENPAKLHDAGELVQQYTDLMPELQQFKAAHKEAIEAKDAAKQGVEEAKQKQKAMADEAKRIEMSFDELKKEQLGRQELVKLSQDLIDILPEKEASIIRLRQRANQENIDLQEKLKREAELKKAQKDVESMKKKLRWLAGIGISSAVAGAGFQKGRQLMY